MSTLRNHDQKYMGLQAEQKNGSDWVSQRISPAPQTTLFSVSLANPSNPRARATFPSPG